MADDNPLVLLALLAGSLYVGKLWLDDLRAARGGTPAPNPLPGATPASRTAVLAAVAGALVLLGIEVAGEYALGIVAAQSKVTVLFGAYTLAAAFLEELIFRGFVVVTQRGRAALVAGCAGASLVFAALHPFLWEWKDGALLWDPNAKAWFSTAMIFAGSLWFYAVRFWKLNPTRSLLPCIAAHAAKNLGVFAVKAAQGFVVGGW
ncbi:MAG: CPBP family intramembrane metalloprotease [Opitutus sp.]|nr:CPBP family intramembrane metalloprotease [Opitutus sp.]